MLIFGISDGIIGQCPFSLTISLAPLAGSSLSKDRG